eukprot:scaffold181263_cov62-Attheya_sp.AAC.2
MKMLKIKEHWDLVLVKNTGRFFNSFKEACKWKRTVSRWLANGKGVSMNYRMSGRWRTLRS